jgi:hypothetical protein
VGLILSDADRLTVAEALQTCVDEGAPPHFAALLARVAAAPTPVDKQILHWARCYAEGETIPTFPVEREAAERLRELCPW